MPRATFMGFRRTGGQVGVRNRLLVLSILGLTTPAARRVARSLPGSLLVAAPHGRGQLGEDAAAYRRQMIGLGRNPNIGAVLVQFWDTPQRVLVAWILAGVWCAACGGVLVALVSLARRSRNAFALTRRELAQDWHVIKEQL